MYGETESESSTGKSFPMAYDIGGMIRVKANSGGFWTKMVS